MSLLDAYFRFRIERRRGLIFLTCASRQTFLFSLPVWLVELVELMYGIADF